MRFRFLLTCVTFAALGCSGSKSTSIDSGSELDARIASHDGGALDAGTSSVDGAVGHDAAALVDAFVGASIDGAAAVDAFAGTGADSSIAVDAFVGPGGDAGTLTRFTERVSISTASVQGDGTSLGDGVQLSSDGRFVVFASEATNLVSGDTNGKTDIFLRDRMLHTTERVSVRNDGSEAGGGTFGAQYPQISGDGRFVAFEADFSNLVTGDTNGQKDVFVRDRMLGTTERVSVNSSGAQATGPAGMVGAAQASMSPDGRYVAFWSTFTNLVTGDTNSSADAFVRDRMAGTTVRVSVKNDGTEATGAGVGEQPSISSNGRFVAFLSTSSNLVAGDTNGQDDIFVRDLMLATTERVSIATDGTQSNGGNFAGDTGHCISDDGRYVVWITRADNLFASDTNGADDIVLRDRMTGTTTNVSVSSSGAQANDSSQRMQMTGDGHYVVFQANATNLTAFDVGRVGGIFVRDLVASTTVLVTFGMGGTRPDDLLDFPAISADGRVVGFSSDATNLVTGDTNSRTDVFVTSNP